MAELNVAPSPRAVGDKVIALRGNAPATIDAATFILEGDARLTNARTPITHTHDEGQVDGLTQRLASADSLLAAVIADLDTAEATLASQGTTLAGALSELDEKQLLPEADTAASLATTNPILANKQEGYETDTGQSKLGNGATAYNDLPYRSVLGSTNLSWNQQDGEVVSDTGNSAQILPADATYSGLMSDEAFRKLDAIEDGATADQTAPEILGLLQAQTQTEQIADGKARGRVVLATGYTPAAYDILRFNTTGEVEQQVASEAPPATLLALLAGAPETATYDTIIKLARPVVIAVASGKAVVDLATSPTSVYRVDLSTTPLEISALAFPTMYEVADDIVYPITFDIYVYNTNGGAKTITVTNHASAPPTGALVTPANGAAGWALPTAAGSFLRFVCEAESATRWILYDAIEVPA